MPIDKIPEQVDVSPAYSLEALQSINDDSRLIERSGGIDSIRKETLITAALEIGAQGGLQSRASQINKFLDKNAELLDMRFQFYPLLIDGEVLPPVIIGSRQSITQSDDGKTLRVADAIYKIKSDARFVSAAPTWRDYLYMTPQTVSLPHESVVPVTSEEESVWHRAVSQGWKAGIDQANEINELALSELEQDYLGMVTFRKLLAEGKVSKPTIQKDMLGVTGNGREMAIGDRVKQIRKDAEFQLDSYGWKAAVLPDQKRAIQSDSRPIEDIRIEVAKTNKVEGANGVRAEINKWLKAWSSGDVKSYLNFYGRDFIVPNNLSRFEWEAKRKRSIERTSVIEIELEDVKVAVNDNYQSASVSFVQKYHFGSTRGVVDKVMLLEMNEVGEWKITYEHEKGPRRRLK